MTLPAIGRPADGRVPLFRVLMSPEARDRAAEVLTHAPDGSMYVGEGPVVRALEHALDDVTGLPGWLATNSCTSALYLALQACRVGPGDRVVTTPMTCSLTTSAIVLRGAAPVWADVDPGTGLVDPVDVARKARGAKAVVVVDFAGRRCDYRSLRDAAGSVPVIEDGAHLAPEPIPAGSHGDYVCLSFQAIKWLTTCDGGAVLTPPWETKRARLLRWAGLDRESNEDFRARQNIQEAGGKWHMTDLAAAVGIANLPLVAAAVDRARANARYYWEALRSLDGGPLRVPPPDDDCSWWLYVVLPDDPASLRRHLASRGVESSPVHRRNDEHDAFAQFPGGPLPGVDAFASRQLAVPVGWWLTDEDRDRVVEAVVEWATSR